VVSGSLGARVRIPALTLIGVELFVSLFFRAWARSSLLVAIPLCHVYLVRQGVVVVVRV